MKYDYVHIKNKMYEIFVSLDRRDNEIMITQHYNHPLFGDKCEVIIIEPQYFNKILNYLNDIRDHVIEGIEQIE